jgi:monofunctional glycosyltransferase
MTDFPLRPLPRRRWFRPWRLLVAAAMLLLLAAGAIGLFLWDLPDVTPLKDRSTTLTIEVRDWQGKTYPFRLGPQNPHWTHFDAFPTAMKWAVIVAEDASFYEHQGLDIPALREAFQYNLEQKRLARGASTITQQLAKNVFLSREKSLWRKLRELLLARRLEQELSKGRILELYLNMVELGPKVYGVGHGARHFFGKTPGEMNPAECAVLAAILPGPRIAFNPQLKPEKVRRRAARILKLLQGRGLLDQAQYAQALEQLPILLGLTAPASLTLPEAVDAVEDDLLEEEVLEDASEPESEEDFPPPPAADEEEPPPASR